MEARDIIDWIEANILEEDSPEWARQARGTFISFPAVMGVLDDAREHFGVDRG